MNVSLHKHIKVYNSYPNKIWKGTKKRFTSGPKAPQCNMRKKPLQKSFAPQSGSWTWSSPDPRGLWTADLPLGVGSCLYQQIRHSPSVAATVFKISWWELLQVPFWRLHELLIKQTRDHMCGRRSRSRLQILEVGKYIEKETKQPRTLREERWSSE